MEANIGPLDIIDSVAKVLLPYMRAIVATANLLQHIGKIIMGSALTLFVLHSVETLLTLIILSTSQLAD